MSKRLDVKYTLFLSDFNKIWIFSRQTFEKKSQMSNFMKIGPVAAELFHKDKRTDRQDEANSRCSQFYKRA